MQHSEWIVQAEAECSFPLTVPIYLLQVLVGIPLLRRTAEEVPLLVQPGPVGGLILFGGLMFRNVSAQMHLWAPDKLYIRSVPGFDRVLPTISMRGIDVIIRPARFVL